MLTKRNIRFGLKSNNYFFNLLPLIYVGVIMYAHAKSQGIILQPFNVMLNVNVYLYKRWKLSIPSL